jgi:hypothetical protein
VARTWLVTAELITPTDNHVQARRAE